MAPAASACDGKLSFCEAAGIPKWRTFLCLPFLVAAKHTSIHGFSVTDAKDCTIHLSRPMVVHADGEYCGEVAEVHFRCLPGKLCHKQAFFFIKCYNIWRRISDGTFQ